MRLQNFDEIETSAQNRIEHFSARALESLTCWRYSANDETVEFAVTNHGLMLDRINRNEHPP